MSSYVIATPAVFAAASSDLTETLEAFRAANAAAAPSTTSLVAAAKDEVSAAISKLFSAYAQEYQALSAEAGVFHQQFVQAMNAGGALYAGAEAANATPLQSLGNTINGEVQAVTGRPLIGNGANGVSGTGQAGGAGGWIMGNGGNGGSGRGWPQRWGRWGGRIGRAVGPWR